MSGWCREVVRVERGVPGASRDARIPGRLQPCRGGAAGEGGCWTRAYAGRSAHSNERNRSSPPGNVKALMSTFPNPGTDDG